MLKLLSKAKFIPRWIILITDVVLSGVAFLTAGAIVFQTNWMLTYPAALPMLAGYMAISLSVLYLMKTHTGLIRYTGSQDMLRIFGAAFLCNLMFCILYQVFFSASEVTFANKDILLLLTICFFIKSSVMILVRTGVRSIYFYLKFYSSVNKQSILIFGTSHTALLLKHALEASKTDKYHVAGFVEINGDKVNRFIEQRKVYPLSALPKLKDEQNIKKLVIPDDKSLSPKERDFIIEQCLQARIKVSTVPPSAQLLAADDGANMDVKLKKLRIEDLLSRDPIKINNEAINGELNGKRILITGAAGSIGAEIVRQVLQFNPALVAMCDLAESPLHELEMEISDMQIDCEIRTIVADVRNYRRMRTLFKEVRPQIIFHAAAYKHVPMMESYPCEAVLTNVLGTKNIADLAVHFDAAKFVMISTDKAVNPTNIMGASKRIAEIYVQSLNEAVTDGYEHLNFVDNYYFHTASSPSVNTKFITTRFGNVLGSNGSVIPRFSAQIKKGGPVTVTHPDITRYFMTIPEAVELVLEAGATQQGGTILVFDMGKPIKIADLAAKMIRLAGCVPGKDIDIVYTGLRPGEKLYEELLNKNESTQLTHHEKIKIANVGMYDYQDVVSEVEELISLAGKEDDTGVVIKMKKIVPEFISNNSYYEKFDEKVVRS